MCNYNDCLEQFGKFTFIYLYFIGIFVVEPEIWLTILASAESSRMFQRRKGNHYF